MRERQPVGILGGTFDPIHLGHLALVDGVLERFPLEAVALLPAGMPPHKTADELAPANHREAMLRLALAGREHIEICRAELESTGVTYTIDTLRHIRRSRRRTDPVFIMGYDALLDIHTWRDHEALLEEFDHIVIHREHGGSGEPSPCPAAVRRLVAVDVARPSPQTLTAEHLGAGGRVFLWRTDPIPGSSTLVRSRVAAGDDPADLVPPAVGRYIHATRLYRTEE